MWQNGHRFGVFAPPRATRGSWALEVPVVFLLLACATQPAPVAPPPPPPPPELRLRFEPLAAPVGDERYALRTSARAWVGEAEVAGFGFHPVARAGVRYGGAIFGQVFKADGTPYVEAERGEGTLDAGDAVCNSQDFISLFRAHEALWMVSHFECTLGDLYLTRLDQDAAGMLTAAATQRVDASAVKGIWNPCAGDVTPWGTHLGSEEYEPDARGLQADGSIGEAWDPWGAWPRLTGALAKPTDTHPYHYGWAPEVAVTSPEGTTSVVKRYALGRFSHELSVVLDDGRTVYQSDDGANVGWFVFVADRANDLSAGHLYAARFDLAGDHATARTTLEWVPLGHAEEAEVKAWIEAGVGFTDLFKVADPTGPGACPEGFVPVRNPNRAKNTDAEAWECLALAAPSAKVADPAKAASRLETRRYANFLGATMELNKAEGVTWDPQRGLVYLAVSDVSKGMAEEAGLPAGLDRVRLTSNRCGVVYVGATAKGVMDTSGQPIPSDFVMTALVPEVVGQEEPGTEGTQCKVDAMANPDNIAFLPGHNLLMLAEDTDRHEANALWAWDVRAKALTRVMTVPWPAEVSGIHWYPDLGGHGYLTVAVQRPLYESGQPTDARRALAGVLGPFPKLD